MIDNAQIESYLEFLGNNGIQQTYDDTAPYLKWLSDDGSWHTEPWAGLDGQLDFLEWLHENKRSHFFVRRSPGEVDVSVAPKNLATLNLREIERNTILIALEMTEFRQKEAAVLLGITPRVLNSKIADFGINHHTWARKNGKKE